MFEDVSRLRPQIRRKVADGRFDFGERPGRSTIHGGKGALWPRGWSLSRRAVRRLVVRRALKRGLDIMIALLALAALLPSLLLVWLVLRHALIAIPTRGRNGKQFGRLNFASDGAARRAIRETGVDRLPELINVLKGDMSLIGPPPDCDGVPAMRPGLAAPPEPAGSRTVTPFADLYILFSFLMGRRG